MDFVEGVRVVDAMHACGATVCEKASALATTQMPCLPKYLASDTLLFELRFPTHASGELGVKARGALMRGQGP